MTYNKAILIIMDGWGHGLKPQFDAIANANTPFVTSLYNAYPNTELVTCGTAVGLPEGQMGNSEVGHLNIGAGRIVYQELQRVNEAIKSGELQNNAEFQALLQYAKTNNKTLHLMGLLSDGGVHAHIEHLKALCTYAHNYGIAQIAIHVFTDGRDTDPKSGLHYIKDLQNHIKTTNAFIATITGRYFAMDRDKRWDRVQLAYNALTKGIGSHSQDAIAAIEQCYNDGVTDEFIKPIIITDQQNKALATIAPDDAVMCFNFRTDRCREITQVLTQEAFPEFDMQPLPLHYLTLTEYDKSFQNVQVIFKNDNLINTLGEVIQQQGLKQIRIAETEKYPHVTFFFSGGRELPFEGEKRLLQASPKDVATYDLKPEMSAHAITNAIIPEIEQQTADFICLNFANTDMVGHTGVWEAVIKSIALL